MTPQQRDATIQHFMKNTQVTVFLISLKAGGVALNLTEASRVFMMDSWVSSVCFNHELTRSGTPPLRTRREVSLAGSEAGEGSAHHQIVFIAWARNAR